MSRRLQAEQATLYEVVDPAECKQGKGLRPHRGLLRLWVRTGVLFIALFSGATVGQAQVWEYLGMPTSTFSAIEVASSDTIFVSGGGGGVFKTTNGGISWDTLFGDFDIVDDLEMHPNNPEILYAAQSPTFPPDGIMKTTDGGTTWFAAGNGIVVNYETYVRAIVVDPVHPETLYAGTSGFLGGDIYKSYDGGVNWTATGTPGLDGISAIVIDPVASNIVYAGTFRGEALHKSTTYGESWEQILLGNPVNSIAIDPVESTVVYAGVSDPNEGFRRSTDGGASWVVSTTGMPQNTSVGRLVVNRMTRDVFSVVFPDSVGLFKSIDIGVTWERVTGLVAPIWAVALAFSPDQTDLYVALNNSGLYRSRVISSVHNSAVDLPMRVTLFQNYPNPFNSATVIEYEIKETDIISIKILDLVGAEVATLVNAKRTPGRYRVMFDGSAMASGTYLLRLSSSTGVVVKKLLLTR